MSALQWLHGQDSTALHRAGQHSNDTDYNPDPKRNLILALMLTLVYLGGCGMNVCSMAVLCLQNIHSYDVHGCDMGGVAMVCL